MLHPTVWASVRHVRILLGHDHVPSLFVGKTLGLAKLSYTCSGCRRILLHTDSERYKRHWLIHAGADEIAHCSGVRGEANYNVGIRAGLSQLLYVVNYTAIKGLPIFIWSCTFSFKYIIR